MIDSRALMLVATATMAMAAAADADHNLSFREVKRMEPERIPPPEPALLRGMGYPSNRSGRRMAASQKRRKGPPFK